MPMTSKYPFGKLFPNNGYAKAAEMMSSAAYLNKFKMSTIESDGNGITELERAFGSGEKSNQLMNTAISAAPVECTAEKNQIDADNRYSESSDVDCEELDEA